MTMTLAQWRAAERAKGRKWTLQQIADAVGLGSPETVRRHLDGRARPRAETMRAYRKLTRGAVAIASWFPEVKGRRRRARAPSQASAP